MREGYQHETVNYSMHFTDLQTGACENTIKSLWQKFKDFHKSRSRTKRALLNSYMYEFIWKKINGENALYHLPSQIAEHHLQPPGSVCKCKLYSLTPDESALWQFDFWKLFRMRDVNAIFLSGLPSLERSEIKI